MTQDGLAEDDRDAVTMLREALDSLHQLGKGAITDDELRLLALASLRIVGVGVYLGRRAVGVEQVPT